MSRACGVDGCPEKHAAKGYCRRHYARLRRTGSTELTRDPRPARTPRPSGRTCTIDGCTAPHQARGLCERHRSIDRRHGSPTYVRPVRLCSRDGCEEVYSYNGFCRRHADELQRHPPAQHATLSAEVESWGLNLNLLTLSELELAVGMPGIARQAARAAARRVHARQATIDR